MFHRVIKSEHFWIVLFRVVVLGTVSLVWIYCPDPPQSTPTIKTPKESASNLTP